jgi:hypothetical protein
MGEVFEIGRREGPPQLHGRKYRTEPFAVAAGVADGHDSISFF